MFEAVVRDVNEKGEQLLVSGRVIDEENGASSEKEYMPYVRNAQRSRTFLAFVLT